MLFQCCTLCVYVVRLGFYMYRVIQYLTSSLWLSVCLNVCLFSVRSSNQLPVTDSSPVKRLERTAAATGTQGGDQQETAGEKQRESGLASLWL